MRNVKVSDDKWRDGVKFLMGQGANPTLTRADQRTLGAQLRGPFARGFSEQDAGRVLRVLGWQTSDREKRA